MPKVSKLSPSLIFSVFRVGLLLKLSLESIPTSDGVESSLDIITSMTPPNKGYAFKREKNIGYLLGFILDATTSKGPQKEVVDFPCVPCPIVGWRLERIPFWSDGHLD